MRRRGFTLMEMLATLVLISAFLMVSGKLFASMLRTMRHADESSGVMGDSESAMRVLRADVWSAAAIQGADRTLTLTEPNGSVTWTAGEEKGLVRTEMAAGKVEESRRFGRMPAKMRFAVAGTRVDLMVKEEKRPGEIVSLVSERMLLAGGKAQ